MHTLVEHGAKIRLADCNGVRPIDLHEVVSLIFAESIVVSVNRNAYRLLFLLLLTAY